MRHAFSHTDAVPAATQCASTLRQDFSITIGARCGGNDEMIRTAIAVVALLFLTGAAYAADSVCDKPVGKLTANQYLECDTQYQAALKAQQTQDEAQVRSQQEQIATESPAETERKLRLRQPVAGEIPIVAPYREIPMR
jgi:hypothetical protein